MKVKQKSFTSNNSKKVSYRPNSSSKTTRIPLQYNINNSVSVTELYPPITFTMPKYKKPSRMGNQITREELYEENMQLKKKLFKMRRELDEVKNKLFKSGLELNKKEKIIREVSNENVTEFTHEINLEKAKESALLTMCREKYIKMKKDFEKKCEENDILKANIKITKLKEYKIQIDIFKKEMEKLKSLYNNSQSNFQNSIKELKQIQDIKIQFEQQHSIINSLNKKNQELMKEIKYITDENNYLKNQLMKNQEIRKRLKNNNIKLKISNDKYMNLKKIRDNSVFVNDDNIRQLNKLKKNLKELELLYSNQSKEYKKLKENKDKINSNPMNNNSNILNNKNIKPFDYNNVKQIETSEFGNNQSQLYKSLYEELKIKISILMNFLREHDIDPEQIIKGKYDGIMNANTNTKISLVKLNSKINRSSTSNSSNNKDATSVGTKENQEQSKNLGRTQTNLESNYNKEEEKINDYIKQNEFIQQDDGKEKETDNVITHDNQDTVKMTESQNSEFNTQDLQNKETQLLALLHTFVKNFEANHITKETLSNKIREISLLFENKVEATKEEFIEPFINLFISSMKVTQSTDIKLINEFFSNFIDDLEGDTNKFFLELIDIFENVVDYTLVENEEEVLNAIAMDLQSYKDELKMRLDKNDKGIITFDNLRKIIEQLNITLTDDYTEFLIYKMKEKVPENSSIFDLNYKVLLEILDRSIINVNKTNTTNELNYKTDEINNSDSKKTEEINKPKPDENIKPEDNKTDENIINTKGNNDIKDNKEEEEKKVNEEEDESKENNDDDEMNIIMSNKLSELKQALKDNNSSFENECKDKVKILEEENDKKINGINKDIFFEIMKKYNIEIEDKVKEAIFELFKIEEDTLIKKEGELFMLDYDKLCSIL